MRDILVALTAGIRPAKVNLVAPPNSVPASALDKRAQLGCCQGGCGGNQSQKGSLAP
jgi:hypothetical protein